MKLAILFFVLCSIALSGTVAVVTPAADSVQIGTSVSLTCSMSLITTAAYIEWKVDGETAGWLPTTNPSACRSLNWNAYQVGNGQSHVVKVLVYDAYNTAPIATSNPVTFKVENFSPQGTSPCALADVTNCSDITVAYGGLASASIPSGSRASVSAFGVTGLSGLPSISQKNVNTGSLSSVSTTLASPITAHHAVLAFWRIQSTTSNGTVTDGPGDVFSNATCIASLGGWKVCWSYAADSLGGAGSVTMSASGGAKALLIHAFDVSCPGGCAALDITPTTNADPDGTVVNSGFIVGVSNTLYLAGFTDGVQAWTAGSGWTLETQDTFPLSMVESSSTISSSSTWYGSTGVRVTTNGSNSGISKTTRVFVDGKPLYEGTSTSSVVTAIVDSTQLGDAAHDVVVRQWGGTCPGCTGGNWSSIGQDYKAVTFSNGSANSQLVSSAQNLQLCTTTQSNCATNLAVTGSLLKANGTLAGASITCVSNNAAVFTIVSTCTPTAAGVGTSYFTMTSGTLSRQVWVNVDVSNLLPNFCSNGSIVTVYTAGCSFFQTSAFGSSGVINPAPTSTYNYVSHNAPIYAKGFNTFEGGLPVPQSASEPAFHTYVSTTITEWEGWCNSYGLKIAFQGENYLSADGSYPLMYTTRSFWATTFNPPAFQYVLNAVQASACGGKTIRGVDEVTSQFAAPLQGVGTGGILVGTNGFTSLTGSAGTCTVNWTGWRLSTSGGFVINGSATALDYVSATGLPVTYLPNRVNDNQFTFSCPAGTYNITSGITQIQPFSYRQYKSDFSTCPHDGATSCPEYPRYDAFKQVRDYQLASAIGGNYPKMTYPSLSGTTGYGIRQWCGADATGGYRVADFCTVYITNGTAYGYVPQHINVYNLIGNYGLQYRQVYSDVQRSAPWIGQTAGLISQAAYHGINVPVTSRVGSLITFTSPHGISNVVPSFTRLQLAGVNYVVSDCPTSLTCHVAYYVPSFSASGTGTITFTDGSTATSVQVYNGGSREGGTGGFNSSTACNNGAINKRGQNFTVSGTGTAMDGKSFWYTPANLNACTQGQWFWEIPATSEGSGTAIVLANNNYLRGSSWPGDSDSGPSYVAVSQALCAVLKCAGTASYGMGLDPGGFDVTQVAAINNPTEGGGGFWLFANRGALFAGTSITDGDAPQFGMNPFVEFGRTRVHFYAAQNTNQVISRALPWMFQPSIAAPDDGDFYINSVRQNASGDTLLMKLFMGDGPQTCTANLTPYLISGKDIKLYYGTWSQIQTITIPAGTTADSRTCEPGAFRLYVFDHNPDSVFQNMPVSFGLADVPTAASVVVDYAYNSYPFEQNQTDMSPQHYNCGSVSPCVVPVDRNLGTVSFRVRYLNSGGVIVATGPVQQQ